MKLYYKRYDENPVEIPENSIILRDDDVFQLKSNFSNYPKPFCLEVDGINKINKNDDGWFDFSKSIIDIGAGLGEYCWLPNFKHAYAFEPNKETAYALIANVLLHDRVNDVDVYQEFLSDSEHPIDFNGWNTLTVTETTKTIQAKPLDIYGFKNIGLIKVDVEEREYEVFCGARKTIEENGCPPIIFECFKENVFGMTKERHDMTYNFLYDYGYVIYENWIGANTHLAIKK